MTGAGAVFAAGARTVTEHGARRVRRRSLAHDPKTVESMAEAVSGAARGTAGPSLRNGGSPGGPAYFPGGGELGALIRAKDWSATALGPVESWPQSLRTAVSVALYSAFPSIVLWGPGLVQVYNDPYRVLMGAKHPQGLGQTNRECWPEAWHINQAIYPRVFAGETVSFRETPYPLAPHGVLEDHYLTLSYGPVRGESGAVDGVFVTVFDVTSEVRARQERDHALADATAERERLYDVFMQAPAAIAVLEGPEHRFTVANPRYRELVGGREVVGKGVADALPEIRGQGFVELLDGVRSTGQAFVASEAVVRLDRRGTGQLDDVVLDFVYQPLQDASGAVFGIMAHAVETTAQVEARRRVEALAAERAAILGQIADVVVTVDPEGRVTFANEAARAIYGEVRLGEVVWGPEQPFRLLEPDGSRRPVSQLPLARALGGERVVDAEWRVVRADGRDVAVMGSAVPVNAADGTRIGAALTVRDVSEQRRLQRQVEVERNRLADVFRQAPAVIAVTEGAEHRIITANPLFRQVVGAHREVEGLPVREALPDLEGQGFFELLDGVYASGEPFIGNELLGRFDRDGDGVLEDGYFNFVYHPLQDAEGQVRGIMIHAVEVTGQVLARKEVESKAEELLRLTHALEQSNRELDQFAYVASHDLKAPLRGIANLAQWIEEDLGERVTGESAEHMRAAAGARAPHGGADRRDPRVLARRPRARRGRAGGHRRAGARGGRAARARRGGGGRGRARDADGRGRAGAAAAGVPEPDRQRGQVRPRRRAPTCGCAWARARRATATSSPSPTTAPASRPSTTSGSGGSSRRCRRATRSRAPASASPW